MRQPFLMLTAALLAATPAMAQPAPGPSDAAAEPWTFGLYLENDGGYLKRNDVEDRHYTNGVAITVAHHPAWADRLAETIPFGPETVPRTAAGYVIGQLMFTPEEITRAELIEEDRPYAGYLYAGAYWQRASETTLDHLQVDVGLIGEASLADHAQDTIHGLLGGREPRGWEHQLRDEPTFQAYLRRKWRVDLNPIAFESFQLDAQLIPQAGLALGTVYRHIEAGATLRVGYRLPDDFGPGRIGDLPAATGRLQRGWSAYGFVGALGRAVAYDHFLEGSDFQDEPHTVEAEPFVGEITAGAALGYRNGRWSSQIRYSQTYLTEAFEGQEGSDSYATLGVTVTGWF